MSWYRHIRGKVSKQEPLCRHTTFKIGGKADFFIEPQDPLDLGVALALLKKKRLPVAIIGSGSNILVKDGRIKKGVIRLSAPAFKSITRYPHAIEAGAGVALGYLVSYAQRYGLSGAEFLAGIPGTVGAALVMNAGISASKRGNKRVFWNIADLVERVTVMNYKGDQKVLHKSQIRFGYRTSDLAKYIVLSARLRVRKARKQSIARKTKEYLLCKSSRQDLATPSAGCVFKNPSGAVAAGKLIDECGLKGASVNGAFVSHRHANFIVNYGCAKAKDVLQLMDLIKKKVKARYRIILKPEIKIWE